MNNVAVSIILIVTTFFNSPLLAQSSINGVVILHNSFFNNKTKVDYVQNAQVDGGLVKTKPTITDANGVFKLTVLNAKPNEKIRIKIVKDGYQVVNPSSLYVLADQADTVRIFMAKPEDIESSRSTYFMQMKALSEQTFKRKIVALNADLKVAYSQPNVDAATISNLEKVLKNTNEGGRKLEAIAQKMATQYSLTNWDDAAPHCQTAFECVQRGAIDSALLTLDEAQLGERAEFLIGQKNRNTVTDESLWTAKFQRNINALMVQADFFQLKWAMSQADSVYQLLLKYDPKNGVVYRKYVDFLFDMNDLSQAKILCEKGLNVVQSSEDKIELMDRLGEMQARLGDLKNAEKVLSQASDMADWEIINNKAIFEPLYALIQLHLAQVFTKMGNFNNADNAFSTALKFHQEYASKSPTRPKDSLLLAATFKGMALNFQRQNKFAQSLEYFDKTSAIYAKFLDMNSLYKNDVAELKNNYGQLYLSQKDTVTALKYLSQEFELYAMAVRSKNSAFDNAYLAAMVNLSALYLNSKDFGRALPVLEDIAAIQKELVTTHPSLYEMDLEKTYKAMGTIYWAQKKYDLADTTFKKMANLHRTILKVTPQYKPEILAFHARFGDFYTEQKKLELAENQYVKSIEMRREFVDKEPLVYAEKHLINLQTIIDFHDTLMLNEIFENKIKAHKLIQNNCRNEMVETQNKLIAGLEKSTIIKEKSTKLNVAYGNLAAYYLSLNMIKEAELAAQKQENNAADFLIFIYGVQEKFKEAQAIFAKISDKKAAKSQCLKWSNTFYNQKVISWDVKTKINKWLENSTAIGLLGN